VNLLQAENLALKLLKNYNLEDWEFKFDFAKRRFGCCSFHRKTISLSRYLTELNPEAVVKNTILHEIAHALVGKTHNHDKVWKAQAVELGCDPKRCYSHEEVIIPSGKYTASCPKCKRGFQAARRKRVACRECCKLYNRGKYSEEFRIMFVEN
jgi:predicted SprT family Zn-dependent metalloprotease